MWKKQSFLLPLLLSTSIAQAQPARRAKAAEPTPAAPQLIVAIIVDQFRYDYTTRFAARYTGGLHTLLNEGAVFLDAHHRSKTPQRPCLAGHPAQKAVRRITCS
jgi:predicted AlkP superfamily pyrophosphatase or phosphodiesterase